MATGSPDRDPTRTGVNSSDELQELRSGIQWLIFLRLIVTFFLLSVAIFFEIKESKYFSTYPATPIFGLICIIFVLSLCYVGVLGRIKNLRTFSLFQIVTDAVLITIIIYFTGGVSSAFTLLYVFTILAAGILLLRRAAMFVAGVSAVLFGGLATLQFYEILPEYMWPWTSVWRSHDPSYILWVLLIHYAIFFFVALLAGTVAGELKTTRISLTIREHEYERLSDLHTNIIKSIPSGIITTDEHATVTYVNETGARLLGSTPAGLIGSPLASLFPEILSTEGAHDRVNRYQIRKKGLTPEPRDFDVSVGELRDRRNQLLGHLVVFSDVTDIRKMEQRAKQSEKQAAFVRIASGMAHEIRNPLASLRGAAELLRETVGDPLSQQHRLLGIVLREADRLNALLSDFILTVNGRQTHTHTVTLDDFLAKILDDFEETSCRPNAISLKRSILTGVSIDCQPDRLKQAILNLLSNALDASPKGSTIQVVVEESEEEIVISISDWGHGIPEHIRERVFEPFYTTKDYGTGLGLPMALSIIEAHGGSLELGDNTPHGVTALVHLPKGRSEKSTGKEDRSG
ncbi:MAG: two-component system sensor histidine kinase NtrB [Desulfomonilaceae bacterium]